MNEGGTIHVPDPAYRGFGHVWMYESESRPGLWHVVMKGDFGVRCTCEGWQYTGNCKHVNQLKVPSEKEQEAQTTVTDNGAADASERDDVRDPSTAYPST